MSRGPETYGEWVLVGIVLGGIAGMMVMVLLLIAALIWMF